jgi:hypothetical protein
MDFCLSINLTGQDRAEISLPREFFLGPSLARSTVFLLFYTINVRTARARPKKLGPTYPVGRSWVGPFQPEITRFFSAQPGPQNAQVYLTQRNASGRQITELEPFSRKDTNLRKVAPAAEHVRRNHTKHGLNRVVDILGEATQNTLLIQ